MTPPKKQIEQEIRKLRVIIDNSGDDEILLRIAYAVETALRWSIEDTVDWQKPSDDVFEEARILKSELGRTMRKIILNFFRAFFQQRARAYRSAGFSWLANFPEGTMGNARGKLLFEFGNLMRAMSQSFCLTQREGVRQDSRGMDGS